MSTHTLSLDDQGPDGFRTRLQAFCSCGWEGQRYWAVGSLDPDFDPWGPEADDAESAAIENGSEHLAGLS